MNDDQSPHGAQDGEAGPELTRLYPTSRIGAGTSYTVVASEAECRALARRMNLAAIHMLTCRFDLLRGQADCIEAQGLLLARLRQSCVVSLEDFDIDLADTFSVRFVPEGQESEELDLEADDEITYEGGVLDLGEAASEQLALALDPFPRKPGVELDASTLETGTNPFAALSKLLPPQ